MNPNCHSIDAATHWLQVGLYSIAAPTVNCVFQLKPSPALQAPGHCHQVDLAYSHETQQRPTQQIHSHPLWPFYFFQTQTCFHR